MERCWGRCGGGVSCWGQREGRRRFPYVEISHKPEKNIKVYWIIINIYFFVKKLLFNPDLSVNFCYWYLKMNWNEKKKLKFEQPISHKENVEFDFFCLYIFLHIFPENWRGMFKVFINRAQEEKRSW